MTFEKSKVHTMLDADDVAVGSYGYFANNLETLKNAVSFDEKGNFLKLKEVLLANNTYRFVAENKNGDCGDYALFYFVEKPEEKKILPYESAFDCGLLDVGRCLKRKTTGAKIMITGINEERICLDSTWYTMKDLLYSYTYLDGSPCGMEVEI